MNKKAITVAAVIAAATPFIAKWEGVRLVAYYDIVGVPTVCYGETRGVSITDRYTTEQCVNMLRDGVADFYTELDPYMNDNIPVGVQASLLDLAYNVGVPSVRSSTMLRKANAGDYKGACAELGKWVRAGGGVVKGLVNRRAESKEKLCLAGL